MIVNQKIGTNHFLIKGSIPTCTVKKKGKNWEVKIYGVTVYFDTKQEALKAIFKI